MERSTLQSECREESGKGAARKLRQQGKIPAVMYGRNEKPLSLSVMEKDVKRILINQGESAIIDLAVKGQDAKPYNAIIREVQTHSATGRILHVDFQNIRLDEKIRTEVSIVLDGDPKGVKEMGGILEHGMRSLKIVCVPTAIPPSIVLDVNSLEIGDSIRVSDIAGDFPEVEFLDEPESTIAIVIPPIVEKEPEAEEEEAVEGAEEPELIEKEKKEGAEESEGDAEE